MDRFKAAVFVALVNVVSLVLPPVSLASLVAVEPSGKIILAGSASEWAPECTALHHPPHCQRNRSWRPAAVRLDADGHLDPSFGSAGEIVDFRASLRESPGFTSIALSQGRGVRLGLAGPPSLRVTALDAGGNPDLGFGRDGMAVGLPTTADSAITTAIVPQPDGSLVAGGDLEAFVPRSFHLSSSVGVAMRFSPSGSPGRLGEVSLGPGALVELADLVPEGDSFVAIGDLSGAKNGPGAFLARFSDAAFPYDPIFGGGAGLVRLGPLPNSEHNVSLEGAAADDGGLIAVGRWGNRILLARYNPNGTPDQGFGEAGLASLSLPASLASLPGAYASAKAESVVVQPDGHYVIAGSARIGNDRGACDIKNGYCEYAFLARFEPNGSLDASFGESGFVIGHRVYERPGLALQPGGKILLSQSSLRVARYNADGSLDTSFGKGGETGAFPCRGSVAARRRSGCLSTAMVSLGAHGLSHGRPMSQFSVRASNPLDPIATVVLQLPRELGGRPGAAGMVRVLTVPRSRVQVRVLPSSVTVSRLGDARGIHVGIGGGVLRRLAPIAATQELLFRVEVEFKDGTTKSFRFRSSG